MNEHEKARLDAWRKAINQPLNAQLICSIRPHTARMLQIFCINHDKQPDVVVETALAEFLIRQGL